MPVTSSPPLQVVVEGVEDDEEEEEEKEEVEGAIQEMEQSHHENGSERE